MNPIHSRGRMLFALSAFALTLAPAAWADIIPVYVPGSSTPLSGIFAYNLNFATGTDPSTSQPASRLVSGNFLTLYDIPGIVSAIAPAGWGFTIQNIGVTAAGTAPTDNVNSNVTFTYNGANVTTDTSYMGFTITSSTARSVASYNYTGQDIKNAGSNAGSSIGFIGFVDTPINTSAIPEPATVGLIGVSLFGLGMGLRRKRRD